MPERMVVSQPRPFIMSSVSNQWTSGICDCFQDLPQCKYASLCSCSLTRCAHLPAGDKERNYGEYLVCVLSLKSLVRALSWKHGHHSDWSGCRNANRWQIGDGWVEWSKAIRDASCDNADQLHPQIMQAIKSQNWTSGTFWLDYFFLCATA